MAPGRHALKRARWPLFGLGGAGLIVAVIVVVAGIGQATGGRACASVASTAGTVTGSATHYVLSGTGNCSYPSRPADGLFVAMSPSEYNGAAACGGYIQVSGPDGSVRAEVIDQCPPCAAGHIDLSEAAFARIAPLSAGLVSVTYQAVIDPPLQAPVELRVQEGSSPYWLALLAINTGNPVASVQVETASGDWLDLARANYNCWIASSGAGAGPFTVRLTDTAGHQVTVRDVALDPGTVQDTGVPMYGAGAVAPAAPVTATAAPTTNTAARPTRVPVTTAPSSPTALIPSQAPATETRVPRSPSAYPSC